MREFLTLFLLLPTTIAIKDYYDEDATQKPVTCEERCLRIHERSLDRIGFSKKGLDRYIDKPKHDNKTMKEVCWKSHDYFYCMKGCTKSVEHEKYVRHVKSRCKPVMEPLHSGLNCLYRYRSFLEIRCSSFMQKAIELKQADDPDLLPDKETCRYLHLYALCLENSVGAFCPAATPFFRRLHLRDYFLNHFLPEDDELFDDQDLDACQLTDFVKEALEGVRVSQKQPEEGEEEETTTLLSTTLAESSTDKNDEAPNESGDALETILPAATEATSVITQPAEEPQSLKDASSMETSPTGAASPSTEFGGTSETEAQSVPITETTTQPETTQTKPPAIVRTLSPSTRKMFETSTTSNFYTASSTLTNIFSTTPPILITREQAAGIYTATTPTLRNLATSTASESEETTTRRLSTTTRRRVFESEEDFSQTPPNFLWGSFRGDNYKVARNYSESFPPNAQFVTPVTIESSSLFGDDGDDQTDDISDYDSPSVIDLNEEREEERKKEEERGEEITVTGVPVEKSTVISLKGTGEESATTVNNQLASVETTSPIYEHAVDTQLQATTEMNDASFDVEDENYDYWSTTVGKILPTDVDDDSSMVDNVEKKVEDENRSTSLQEASLPSLHALDKKQAESNFDRALEIEEPEVTSTEKNLVEVTGVEVTETTTVLSSTKDYTPLINGGRVAVKSIKHFLKHGEDSTQEWSEDPHADDSHVNIVVEGEDLDDYDKDSYVTGVGPTEEESSNVRRSINFILVYTSLFFVFLTIFCCILVICIRRKRNEHPENTYKIANSL